jgi:hypothetical protein
MDDQQSSIPTLSLQIMAGLCLMLCLAGCATQRVDWAARVGHYTYEQAVRDMGPPEEQAKLADGTMTAEWLIDRGYTYTQGGPDPYGPFYATYPSTETAPSKFLRLSFGSSGQLTAWKVVYK